MPAKILKVLELLKKNFPNNEAVEPKVINTKEKPKVKRQFLLLSNYLFFPLIYLMNYLKYKIYTLVSREERMEIKN